MATINEYKRDQIVRLVTLANRLDERDVALLIQIASEWSKVTAKQDAAQ